MSNLLACLMVAALAAAPRPPSPAELTQAALDCQKKADLDGAGENLGAYRLLAPDLPAALDGVKTWVAKEARRLFDEALALQAQKKLAPAARAYLRAVRADASLLGLDDHGLRDLAARALASSVAKHPAEARLRFDLGAFRYLTADYPGAIASLNEYLPLETDAVRAGRGQIWLDRAKREQADADAAAARERRDAASARAVPPPPIIVEAPDPNKHPEGWWQRKGVVETAIKNTEFEISTLAPRVKNAAFILGGGRITYPPPTSEETQLMMAVDSKKRLEAELATFK